MHRFEFETPEEIADALVERAGRMLPLRWQACFVRQHPRGDCYTESSWSLLATAGEVPLTVRQLQVLGPADLHVVDAAIVPIEHAGRVTGLWLLGSQRHGTRLGPVQLASLADLAQAAAAPLEVAVLRTWAARLGRSPTSVGGARTDVMLTRRQLQVAALIGRGLNNQQIAQRLGIRPGTVAKHIEQIMARMGARSRSQIAAWVARHAWLESENLS